MIILQLPSGLRTVQVEAPDVPGATECLQN